MIGADEGGTLRTLKAIRKELIDPTIANHYGRPVKTTGDGLLAELAVSVDALRCATEIQAGMAERNVTAPEGERIEFRVGLNVGDIVVEDDDIFGDGVNVAARFEGLAEPGGICVSARIEEVLGPGKAATVAPLSGGKQHSSPRLDQKSSPEPIVCGFFPGGNGTRTPGPTPPACRPARRRDRDHSAVTDVASDQAG